MYVCHMQQLGCHCTDVHEIWYSGIFWKYVKVQVWFKYFFNDVSEFFLEWEMFLDRSCRENSNSHFICTNFEGGNCAIYGRMWKEQKTHCCDSTATIVNANVPQWYITGT